MKKNNQYIFLILKLFELKQVCDKKINTVLVAYKFKVFIINYLLLKIKISKPYFLLFFIKYFFYFKIIIYMLF